MNLEDLAKEQLLEEDLILQNHYDSNLDLDGVFSDTQTNLQTQNWF